MCGCGRDLGARGRQREPGGWIAGRTGYELVSPPQKDGAGVMVGTSRTHAAADGGALAFAALAGFGDVHGTGVGVDYLAERTTTPGAAGSTTRAITPAQGALNIAGGRRGTGSRVPGVQQRSLAWRIPAHGGRLRPPRT